MHTVYAGTTGTTTYAANGRRGTVTGINYSHGGRRPVSAFIVTDEGPREMWLATLSEKVDGTTGFYIVTEAHQIDRDEFDRVTGLAELRGQMGWAA